LPPDRELTPLNAENTDQLIADMLQLNEDGYARELTLLGLDAGEANKVDSFTMLRVTLDNFSDSAQGPLKLAVYQFDDSPTYVFFPSEPHPVVDNLLRTWDLTPMTAGLTKLAYRKLRRTAFERVKNNILRLAFPNDPQSQILKCVP